MKGTLYLTSVFLVIAFPLHLTSGVSAFKGSGKQAQHLVLIFTFN